MRLGNKAGQQNLREFALQVEPLKNLKKNFLKVIPEEKECPLVKNGKTTCLSLKREARIICLISIIAVKHLKKCPPIESENVSLRITRFSTKRIRRRLLLTLLNPIPLSMFVLIAANPVKVIV